MGQWRAQRSISSKAILIICLLSKFATSTKATSTEELSENISNIDRELVKYVDELFDDRPDRYDIAPGLCIEKKEGNYSHSNTSVKAACQSPRKIESVEEYFNKRWDNFANTHVLAVNVPQTARFFGFGQGKSSFLAGFGMGFMALFLKKLLLPVFIVAQIVKSVLIAMFLPSILGSLGKLVGKGLSSFSGVSGSSGGGLSGGTHVEDFEFKDTSPYNNNDMENVADQDINGDNSFSLNTIDTTVAPQANSRFGFVNNRLSYVPPSKLHSENYYLRQPQRKTDFKVFHKIPSSSLLLTTYDPFYSPLLSRLDAVFQQLGLGNGKSAETEKCREKLICMMYANPAKYAPYSNLVSAQLSRELNELRKPASDNPEILRFFRYMKAAKDGQDGEQCLAHEGCSALNASNSSPAMITTFNDINKLVQARKLS